MLPSSPTPAEPLLRRIWLRLVTWQPSQHSVATRFVVALLITALAAWIRVALAPAESGGRFITLSLAAAVAALYGGFWVGMFSTLVGMLFINFLLVKPYFSLAFDNPLEAFWLNTWHLLTQLVVVGAISFMQGQNRRLRQATNEVRLRAKQLEDTFEHSSTGMAHSHIDGRWIRVNQTYCDLVGYSRAEIQSLSFRDFTHPDDLALDVEQLGRTLRGEIANYSVEKRYLHKQGRVIWVLLTVSLVRTEDGQPDYLIAVVQDITARKATELALRTSEQLLRQAHQIAGLASWQADVATRRFVTLWGSHEVLDLPTAEFTDDELLAMTHPDDRPVVMKHWAMAVRGLEDYNIEYRLSIRGEYHWFLVRAVFDRDAQGRAVRAVGVTQDVTERRRHSMEIQELNASLEQRIDERTHALKAAYDELESYSYAVAHDLRSPLRIINGFAQALREDNPSLDDSSVAHLGRIMGASKKMGELIDGLLTLSQFSRGELQRKPVNISHIANRLLEEFASADPQRNVRWEVEPGLNVMADPPLIEALMQNLLNNAWKYTSRTPQAKIRVYAQVLSGQTRFCVSDNGAGFDMARASKLFQPFQRLHMPNEFAGLGIGLATSLRIVQRHGGSMAATAETGQGATFCFNLYAPLAT